MRFPEPGVSEEGAKNKDPGINTTDIKEDGLGAFQVGWQQYFFADQIQLTGRLIWPQESPAGRTRRLRRPSVIK